MEDFIKKIYGYTLMDSWCNERISLIFHAFKGYKHPQYNQSQVIHAGQIQRDCIGALLFDAWIFHIKDALILKDQLKQIEGGNYSGALGLNKKQRTEL